MSAVKLVVTVMLVWLMVGVLLCGRIDDWGFRLVELGRSVSRTISTMLLWGLAWPLALWLYLQERDEQRILRDLVGTTRAPGRTASEIGQWMAGARLSNLEARGLIGSTSFPNGRTRYWITSDGEAYVEYLQSSGRWLAEGIVD